MRTTSTTSGCCRRIAANVGVALQNARLFNETQEALSHQTATADILRVISSSPTDVQPVFDAIVNTALKLLACDFTALLRCDGATFSPVAFATPGGLPMERRRANGSRRPGAELPVARHRVEGDAAHPRLERRSTFRRTNATSRHESESIPR